MSKKAKSKETKTLTPRQLQILTMIRDGRRRNGYSPTLQEMADQLKISKITVFEHVEALIRKGLLTRASHRARSLEVTADASFPDERPTILPLVGQVAAGIPVEAYEADETLDLEEIFVTPHNRKAVEVKGDSMIDEHICEGDFVIVEDRKNPKNGEIVIALADNENTLKRFYKDKGQVRLQPANGNYQPIFPKECEIQGVVIGVIRRYKAGAGKKR